MTGAKKMGQSWNQEGVLRGVRFSMRSFRLSSSSLTGGSVGLKEEPSPMAAASKWRERREQCWEADARPRDRGARSGAGLKGSPGEA